MMTAGNAFKINARKNLLEIAHCCKTNIKMIVI